MTDQVTLEKVEAALRRVPAERLRDVLVFIEFTQYQAVIDQDDEDEALWSAVEANQAYKQAHPDQVERHKTGTEFLEAVSDL